MRSTLALFLILALHAATPARAATAKDAATSLACDTPPCTREELERYERRLIKRLQRANMLAAEARFRGETETADRLHRVFERNFERRRAVRQAIDNPSY
jgi:hypothetical protein